MGILKRLSNSAKFKNEFTNIENIQNQLKSRSADQKKNKANSLIGIHVSLSQRHLENKAITTIK